MKLVLEHNANQDLIARISGGQIIRPVIGVPLMVLGGFTFLMTFSSFITQLRENGAAALGEAFFASFFLLLMTAFTLPLGYWLVFSRHWILMKSGTRDIVAVSDWRFGRKEKVRPVTQFRAVSLAEEPLDKSTSSNSKGGSLTFVDQIRLLPADPRSTPSIEIGWLDLGHRAESTELAREIAAFLELPLEIGEET